jgi:Phage terminase-like protein, large subunit
MVLVTVPRQSGKSTLVRALGVQAALAEGGRAWYSAQTRNDARDGWMDAVEAVTRSPLAPAVQVRLTNGSEALRVSSTGGTFRVFAPTPEGLHGRQVDRVFFDEIWAHDAQRGTELLSAAVPAMATRPRPQVWLLSTAGTDASTWLKERVAAGRDAALAQSGRGLAYFEWSLPDDADPADLDAVCAAHPAVGLTIPREAVEAARATLPAGEFARGYGNRWTSAVETVLDPAAWAATAVEETVTRDAGPVAFGVDLARDRSCASIVAAGVSPVTGRLVLEVVDHAEGVGWVRARVAELVERWKPAAVCLDPVGPSATAADELTKDATAPLVTTRSRELATACLQLYDAVHGASALRLGVHPHAALDAAAVAAGKRALAGGWAWDRVSEVPMTPLIAATLAMWALDHAPEAPAPVPQPAIY